MFGRIMLPVLLSVISLGAASSCVAASSSWVEHDQASTRLIAAETGVPEEAARLKFGWHVRLAPGWKTYWRSPGDAGLPPRFDWSGSVNVESVGIAWPVPERLTAFGYDTTVYSHEVVLPLTVTLSEPGRATRVRVKVDYMVCAEICVPLAARHELLLPAGGGRDGEASALIARFDARVPPRQDELCASRESAPLWIEGVDLSDQGLGLLVRTVRGAHGLDAFVDGPETAAFGRPKRVATTAATLWALQVPVYGTLPRDLQGVPLAIVVVNGADDAIEWRGKVAEAPERTSLKSGGTGRSDALPCDRQTE
ncbi:MAG: hypothetical protein D6763_02360 [Alphaproteobacteria bacterium]|nr:MAG: hypothetical protein D6763_02360 [Alphaproteobacteria bacterium]